MVANAYKPWREIFDVRLDAALYTWKAAKSEDENLATTHIARSKKASRYARLQLGGEYSYCVRRLLT
jgi:hypothetical protein